MKEKLKEIFILYPAVVLFTILIWLDKLERFIRRKKKQPGDKF